MNIEQVKLPLPLSLVICKLLSFFQYNVFRFFKQFSFPFIYST